MSTKVAKVSKTSTNPVPAKAVSASKTAPVPKSTKSLESTTATITTKLATIRLSENDKKNNPNYILNPNTNKYVKRETPYGKKLVNAEKTGEEVPKTMTETERLILVVQTLQNHFEFEDSAIKTSLKPINTELPRGFPVAWGGKPKSTRSPDRPKQPSNAYIYFTQAVRQSVMEANEGLSNTAIIALMGKMWKETPAADRTEYVLLAEQDKLRYEEEKKIFIAEHPDQARSGSNSEKPTRVNAYHKYCEENRDKVKKDNPDADGRVIAGILSDQWDEVKKDKTELAKYQELADKANEGFEERVVEYHNNDPKLSEAEQKKADDPENYELNPKTGRYVEKDKPKAPKVEKESAKKTKASKAKSAKKKNADEKNAEAEAEVEADEGEDQDQDILEE